MSPSVAKLETSAEAVTIRPTVQPVQSLEDLKAILAMLVSQVYPTGFPLKKLRTTVKHAFSLSVENEVLGVEDDLSLRALLQLYCADVCTVVAEVSVANWQNNNLILKGSPNSTAVTTMSYKVVAARAMRG